MAKIKNGNTQLATFSGYPTAKQILKCKTKKENLRSEFITHREFCVRNLENPMREALEIVCVRVCKTP